MEPMPDELDSPVMPAQGATPELVTGPTADTRPRYRGPIAAASAAVVSLLFQLMVSRLGPFDPAAFYGAALLLLLITLVFTVSLARALRSAGSQFLFLLFSAVAALPFVTIPFLRLTTPQQVLWARRIYEAYVLAFHVVPGLRGLLLVSLAVAVGVALSRLVREIKILLPIAVVLALVDLYVVFGGGLVAQANSGSAPAAQAAMRVLTVGLTPRLPANIAAPPPVAAGFADFLFIALFFACFARFKVPARRTFVLLCGILCLYMAAVIVGHLDLPALVPIAVVVIGANLSAFRYKREEAFAMLYTGLIVVVILGALLIASHR